VQGFKHNAGLPELNLHSGWRRTTWYQRRAKICRWFESKGMITSFLQHKQTILVVEDESTLRQLAVDIVEDAGFVAVSAENADEAVEILEHREDIDIVFTDIDMPGSVNGLRLATCIHDRWPPIEIIVTSGQYRPKESELPERAVFLSKPYKISKITNLFHELAK
jgi:CheY-like chemotaxis protein